MESACYNHNSPGQYARDRATGPRGQYSRGAPGAPGRKATDAGTERRPTRTAKGSTCGNHSPGKYARDGATGPRGQYNRGAPGAPGRTATDVGTERRPHAHGYGERVL